MAIYRLLGHFVNIPKNFKGHIFQFCEVTMINHPCLKLSCEVPPQPLLFPSQDCQYEQA